MENWQKGLIAEHKVVIRAMEKGLVLAKPLSNVSYDFVMDDKGKLSRVQVKWADRDAANAGGVVLASLTTRRNGKTTRYETGAFDLILVYIPKLDKICAFGPEFFGKAILNIRIAPTKNNQKTGCVMADQYFW